MPIRVKITDDRLDGQRSEIERALARLHRKIRRAIKLERGQFLLLNLQATITSEPTPIRESVEITEELWSRILALKLTDDHRKLLLLFKENGNTPTQEIWIMKLLASSDEEFLHIRTLRLEINALLKKAKIPVRFYRVEDQSSNAVQLYVIKRRKF
ncbi:MAG TPA: hypothetical protein VD998_03300 [Verrucomicrobiae bacterium]|nr:hypothetical protein [Verrucomicrobiae bacterium]